MTVALRYAAVGISLAVAAGCGAPSSARSGAAAKWQVVKAPGTSSCAAVILVYPGDFEHREQLGVYDSQREAEAALARFKTTPDPMTVPGHTICQ